MKLDDDLYAYIWTDYRQNNCNTYLIGGEVPTLIDPGHQHLTEGLITKMQADGIEPDDIKVVLNTHCHPDHMEGSVEFLRRGARVAVHAAEEDFIKKVGPRFYQMFGLTPPEISFAFYLEEGELEIGAETVEVVHTPGHSPGEVSIYWPGKKALFSGDVIFSAGVGRTDFPGGDGKLLKESIKRLAEFDAEWLLSGHGDLIKGRDAVRRNFDDVAMMYFDYI